LLLHPACRDAESASAHTDVSIVAANIPNLTPLFSIPSAGVRLPSQQLLQNCCKISEISSEEKKTRQKISERRRRPTEARAEAVWRPLALPQQWRLQHSLATREAQQQKIPRQRSSWSQSALCEDW
jgi:hypothetical protein